jgi:hypothetical protein
MPFRLEQDLLSQGGTHQGRSLFGIGRTPVPRRAGPTRVPTLSAGSNSAAAEPTNSGLGNRRPRASAADSSGTYAALNGVADTFGTYNKPFGPSRNTVYAAFAVRPTAAALAPCGLDGLGHSGSTGVRDSVRGPAGRWGSVGPRGGSLPGRAC